MIQLIKKTIDEYSMLNGAKSIIVALSGGADSVALLHAATILAPQYGVTVSAAHLNHSLRGAESERDKDFCIQLCKDLKVSLVVKTEDVKGYAESTKQSIELAARKMRYEFFEELCVDGAVIATAHTASDNLETMLLNLARGTALKGLCGIPPKRDTFIRPLIYCSRKDVEDYCAVNGLSFVTDSSNLSDDYTRNVIRHKIVPVLKDINSAVEHSAANTAKTLRLDNLLLEQKADELFNTVYDGDTLDAECLKNADTALATRIIARYLNVKGCEVSNALVTKIYDLIGTDFPKFSVQKDMYCYCADKRLFVGGITSQKTDFSVSIEKTLIKDLPKTQKINSLLLKNAFDYDKLKGELVIRTRLEGDSIKLTGRPKKTLKKLYNECKIPVDERETLPVIADSNGVIWVFGVGVAERARVDNNSQNIGIIRI